MNPKLRTLTVTGLAGLAALTSTTPANASVAAAYGQGISVCRQDWEGYFCGYEHIAFNGTGLGYLLVANESVGQLGELNNRIASVYNNSLCTVTLYKDDNQAGESLVVHPQETFDFYVVERTFNDTVSSLSVDCNERPT
ncbi:peptidase inhibitor family I36 protein [Streptomyces sp. B6B3]|uniref:peptidase inhibitor family I36 protein n=1 Tax=Streptomyces sp. B6B3 TaxID=3153570 RepID=UPI00325CD63D